MNILIIGAGGREHALCWKINQSPLCDALYVAPGNGGTQEIATNLDIDVKDFSQVKEAISSNSVELVVVGPEEPLVLGLVDELKSDPDFRDLLIVGPGKKGAALEGSKQFAKDFMVKYNVPTAAAKVFDADNINEGYDFLSSLNPPYVLKADGLAAGKGVLITSDLEEAKNNLTELIVNQKFGKASAQVLIEEFLSGIELSVFVLTDGKDYIILPEAKDYKRIGDGDTGPNTGGMGAISPVLFADEAFMKKVEDQVVKPTVRGIGEEGMDYCGFIFIGLMNDSGDPKVIEYNVRMGDPETEVVMPRIASDLVPALIASAQQNLKGVSLKISPETATTVMMVSEGYPESYEKGREMKIGEISNAIAFHAGTTMKGDKLLTNGGRVIALTGMGRNMETALKHSYQAVSKVDWKGKNYRKDIGFDLKKLGQ